jgi:hypothetical protein
MQPHTPPPPLRLLERPPSRRAAPARVIALPARWWSADGLKRIWQTLRLVA